MKRRSVPSPTALLVRAVMTGGVAALGAFGADALLARRLLGGPNDVLYLGLAGALLGWLVGAPPARLAERRMRRLAQRLADVPPDAVIAGFVGALTALLITVLLDNVLARVPGFTWYWSLLMAGVLTASSVTFFVANRGVLRLPRAAGAGPDESTGRSKLLDTSAIIDGRLVEVAEARFLDGQLLVPAFVLGELQNIADDADTLRRRRGRRGLEVLERLAELPGVVTEIVHDDVPGAADVDEKLVRLALQLGADLVTTDYNLHQVASLQGVRVLNLHRLASAVKATHLSGETLSLTVVRPGKEAGQGLAYLDDGTMIVIDGASHRIGDTVGVTVTSTLQTNVGRMIFAKLLDDDPDDDFDGEFDRAREGGDEGASSTP